MNVHRAGPRLAIFAFVAALLMQGAVPLFASAAARLRGVSVVEICTVYGVALPGHATGHAMHDQATGSTSTSMHASMDMAMAMASTHDAPVSMAAAGGSHDAPSPHRHDAGDHGGDHCALSGLAAMAADLAATVVVAAPSAVAPLAAPGRSRPARRDASARWAALVGHGPPSLS